MMIKIYIFIFFIVSAVAAMYIGVFGNSKFVILSDADFFKYNTSETAQTSEGVAYLSGRFVSQKIAEGYLQK